LRVDEPVEFRVAFLKSRSMKNIKEKDIPFNILIKFINKYNNFVRSSTRNSIKSLYLMVGRNPAKAIFIPQILEEQTANTKILLGNIGFVYKQRYPNVFDEVSRAVSPLILPRTQGLMYLAHFAIFEHNNVTYVIYEMNSTAPSISNFTNYICHAWQIIDPGGASTWCPLKYYFVAKDPKLIIANYNYITGLTISGDLRIAEAIASFTGVNMKDALLKRKSKRFSLELSGRGEPLNFTISELVEFLELIHEYIVSKSLTRLLIKVKKFRKDKEITINLLQNILSFLKEVPRATDHMGRELGSLSTPDAYRTLKELVREAIDMLSKDNDKLNISPRVRRKTLEYYLSS